MIFSNMSPSERRPDPRVITWFENNEHLIYLSVITIAEIQFGIENLLARGATRRAAALQRWLGEITLLHSSRLLAVDPSVAAATAKLWSKAKYSGHGLDFRDAAIAATALVYRMTVLTEPTSQIALSASLSRGSKRGQIRAVERVICTNPLTRPSKTHTK